MRTAVQTSALCTLIACAFVAQAQTARPTNRSRAPQMEAPATTPVPPATPSPTGPIGIGGLKIGMTKEAVQALGADEPVRFAGDLVPVPADVKSPLPPGSERWKGKLSVGSSTLDTTLTFKEGLLSYVSLYSDSDSVIEFLARQIADKYGPGKSKDERTEEQCIYRNGNSFTLKSGVMATDWSTPSTNGGTITTSVSKIEINVCPSNLRYGTTGGIKLHSLTFQLVDKPEASAPKKSLF